MAVCGFGTSGLKVANLELGSVTPKLNNLRTLYGLRAQRFVQFDDLVLSLSHRSKNGTMIKCRSWNSAVGPDSTTNLGDDLEATLSSDAQKTHVPNPFEVESLLTVLCDTTSIMEFELKLGEFQLHVTRGLSEQSSPPQPPLPAPVTGHSVPETTGSGNSEPSPSLALTKPLSSSNGVQTLLDKAADEGLKILQSPRVGYFRRSRTIKGKRAPPSCKEKDTVKEGQVLCYIEQLGGEIPVESDFSGEVVKILKEDGGFRPILLIQPQPVGSFTYSSGGKNTNTNAGRLRNKRFTGKGNGSIFYQEKKAEDEWQITSYHTYKLTLV